MGCKISPQDMEQENHVLDYYKTFYDIEKLNNESYVGQNKIMKIMCS